MQPELVAENRSFDGRQLRCRQRSDALDCDMHFSVHLPPQAGTKRVRLLYWLSGLTCTDESFVQKAGAQRGAAKHGFAIVAPDTSPRGEAVSDDLSRQGIFGYSMDGHGAITIAFAASRGCMMMDR